MPTQANPLIIYLTITDVVIIIICLYYDYGIFINLFEFHTSIICIQFQFSDKHNLIFEPHWLTKIFAILSPLVYALDALFRIMLTWFIVIEPGYQAVIQYLHAIAHTLYYLYLFSVIKT